MKESVTKKKYHEKEVSVKRKKEKHRRCRDEQTYKQRKHLKRKEGRGK